MSMFGITKNSGNNNFENTGMNSDNQINLGVSQIGGENTNSNNFNVTTGKKSGILGRISKKQGNNVEKDKEEEALLIQKNIDNSLKVNLNDMIIPGEMSIKNSLFFRLHVTGVIESANVK
jgi:hypothetical protein